VISVHYLAVATRPGAVCKNKRHGAKTYHLLLEIPSYVTATFEISLSLSIGDEIIEPSTRGQRMQARRPGKLISTLAMYCVDIIDSSALLAKVLIISMLGS
jgi:hypothetical protein